MARCYSACVRNRQPPRHSRLLPAVWLVSDARIDPRIERALERLPPGSALIFRHYHLPEHERRARFRALRRKAHRHGHLAVLSGTAREARRAKADGAYGSPARLAGGPAGLRLVTVHTLRELAKAHRMRADAALLSPVFATKTHPGAPALGPLRFRLIAARARVPVIALGGMSARRARAIGAKRWAAIASLAQARRPAFPFHS